MVSNVLEIEETTLFLSLSAFQSEHSGLGTFPIKSKMSFLHFYCMLREEEGAVHILTKSVLELQVARGVSGEGERGSRGVLMHRALVSC